LGEKRRAEIKEGRRGGTEIKEGRTSRTEGNQGRGGKGRGEENEGRRGRKGRTEIKDGRKPRKQVFLRPHSRVLSSDYDILKMKKDGRKEGRKEGQDRKRFMEGRKVHGRMEDEGRRAGRKKERNMKEERRRKERKKGKADGPLRQAVIQGRIFVKGAPRLLLVLFYGSSLRKEGKEGREEREGRGGKEGNLRVGKEGGKEGALHEGNNNGWKKRRKELRKDGRKETGLLDLDFIGFGFSHACNHTPDVYAQSAVGNERKDRRTGLKEGRNRTGREERTELKEEQDRRKGRNSRKDGNQGW
jgi:hypothetical protein